LRRLHEFSIIVPQEKGVPCSALPVSLDEVLVTVAIVAILAAIAIPNYTDYVKRGKLTEATSTLLSMRTLGAVHLHESDQTA